MSRLTLDLEPLHIRTIDWIMSGDDSYVPDDSHRAAAIADLLLDHAHQLEHRSDDAVDDRNSLRELRTELEVVREERDEAVKTVARQRQTISAFRSTVDAGRRHLANAVATTTRLRESRARYRDLLVQIEAALTGNRTSDNYDGLDRRLRRALRDAGFRMPARPRRPREAPARKPAAGRRARQP